MEAAREYTREDFRMAAPASVATTSYTPPNDALVSAFHSGFISRTTLLLSMMSPDITTEFAEWAKENGIVYSFYWDQTEYAEFVPYIQIETIYDFILFKLRWQ